MLTLLLLAIDEETGAQVARCVRTARVGLTPECAADFLVLQSRDQYQADPAELTDSEPIGELLYRRAGELAAERIAALERELHETGSRCVDLAGALRLARIKELHGGVAPFPWGPKLAPSPRAPADG